MGNLNLLQFFTHERNRFARFLYPGDATEGGKLLRLKQQYFLCSVSLQDIISRFKERRQGPWNWSEFPTKVAGMDFQSLPFNLISS
ncbi:hypothetical protein RYX36_004862 [Vicia faba]